jgi:hypothetical protein
MRWPPHDTDLFDIMMTGAVWWTSIMVRTALATPINTRADRQYRQSGVVLAGGPDSRQPVEQTRTLPHVAPTNTASGSTASCRAALNTARSKLPRAGAVEVLKIIRSLPELLAKKLANRII